MASALYQNTNRVPGVTHGDSDGHGVTVEIAVCGGSRVSPSSVRELVPVVCPRQVRLDPVRPAIRQHKAWVGRLWLHRFDSTHQKIGRMVSVLR